MGIATTGCAPAQAPQAPVELRAGSGSTCSEAPRVVRPAAIDVSSDTRALLESGEKNGIVLVHQGCGAVVPLPECRLISATRDDAYVFAAVSPRVAQFKTTREASRDPEVHDVSWSSTFPEEGPIELTVVFAGRLETSRSRVDRAHLEGNCDGVTHFVRRVDLGALSYAWERRGHSEGTKIGDLENCPKALTLKPANGCRASVRWELVPIGP